MEIVRFLVEHGARVDSRNHGGLRSSAAGGFIEVASYLLAAGSDGRAGNNFALKGALRAGNNKMAKLLLDKVYRPDWEKHGRGVGDDVVRVCAEQGNVEIMEHLITLDANLTCHNHLPMRISLQFGNRKMVGLLRNTAGEQNDLARQWSQQRTGVRWRTVDID